MTTSMHNASDVAFLNDLVILLHRSVRMSDIASSRSPARAVRALASALSASASVEIAAVRSCVVGPDPVTDQGQPPQDDAAMLAWMLPTAGTDDLAQVAIVDFDEHYLKQLAAHHHAVIERSRIEMVEGLSSYGRGFAEHAITENAAGLHRIHDLSAN